MTNDEKSEPKTDPPNPFGLCGKFATPPPMLMHRDTARAIGIDVDALGPKPGSADAALAEIREVLGRYPVVAAHVVVLHEAEAPGALTSSWASSLEGADEDLRNLREAIRMEFAERHEDEYVASGQAEREEALGLEREKRLADRLVSIVGECLPGGSMSGSLPSLIRKRVQEALMAEGLWNVDEEGGGK